jgi:hypothetical protein
VSATGAATSAGSSAFDRAGTPPAADSRSRSAARAACGPARPPGTSRAYTTGAAVATGCARRSGTSSSPPFRALAGLESPSCAPAAPAASPSPAGCRALGDDASASTSWPRPRARVRRGPVSARRFGPVAPARSRADQRSRLLAADAAAAGACRLHRHPAPTSSGRSSAFTIRLVPRALRDAARHGRRWRVLEAKLLPRLHTPTGPGGRSVDQLKRARCPQPPTHSPVVARGSTRGLESTNPSLAQQQR